MLGTNNGIQTFVNRELPPAAPGDWAGANIRASVPVGPWSLVAPPSGTLIGAIAWANPITGLCTNYFQPNSFPGFIHREQQGQGLQTSGGSIVPNVVAPAVLSGNPVTALAQGDFWGLFQGGCSVGNSVYANPTTGGLIAGASGAGVSGAITAASLSSAGVLTVGTITGTPLALGQIITGVGVPPGSYIASLGTGAGGTGTYNLANLDGTPFTTVASEAMAYAGQQPVQWLCMENIPAAAQFTATLAASTGPGPFGVLTVSAVASGTIVPYQWVQSAGATPVPLSSNIQIIQQLTGTTGGTGTYLTSGYITVAAGETFTTYQGQLAKISSWSPL